jgi:hypothetical protein
MRYRRKRPEDALQRCVLQHLRIRAPHDCFYFHPANGGQRSPVEAAILNGLGVRAGVPDLIIISLTMEEQIQDQNTHSAPHLTTTSNNGGILWMQHSSFKARAPT